MRQWETFRKNKSSPSRQKSRMRILSIFTILVGDKACQREPLKQLSLKLIKAALDWYKVINTKFYFRESWYTHVLNTFVSNNLGSYNRFTLLGNWRGDNKPEILHSFYTQKLHSRWPEEFSPEVVSCLHIFPKPILIKIHIHGSSLFGLNWNHSAEINDMV